MYLRLLITASYILSFSAEASALERRNIHVVGHAGSGDGVSHYNYSSANLNLYGDLTSNPTPTVTTIGFGSQPNTTRVGIFSEYGYQWTITAPSVAAADLFQVSNVRVTAVGSYSLSASGNGIAEVLLQYSNLSRSGNAINLKCGSVDSPYSYNSFCGFAAYAAPINYFRSSGTTFSGYIGIEAGAYNNTSTGDWAASAFLDPSISIAQSFADANPGFVITHIVLDSPPPPPPPGPTVPEPGTWALFIVGFGVLGLRLRSRRMSTTAD